jgi:hypothetical protein
MEKAPAAFSTGRVLQPVRDIGRLITEMRTAAVSRR